MNRSQKELVVDTLRDKFGQATGSFVVNVKGMTVSQTQQLRTQLREQGGELKIAKVRLVKKAIGKESYGELLGKILKDQVGIVFARKESSPVAKVLYTFAKQCDQLKLVAGCVDAEVMDSKGVMQIALLPSREVLLAQLCGLLKSPMVQLAIAVDKVKEQKSQEQ